MFQTSLRLFSSQRVQKVALSLFTDTVKAAAPLRNPIAMFPLLDQSQLQQLSIEDINGFLRKCASPALLEKTPNKVTLYSIYSLLNSFSKDPSPAVPTLSTFAHALRASLALHSRSLFNKVFDCAKSANVLIPENMRLEFELELCLREKNFDAADTIFQRLITDFPFSETPYFIYMRNLPAESPKVLEIYQQLTKLNLPQISYKTYVPVLNHYYHTKNYQAGYVLVGRIQREYRQIPLELLTHSLKLVIAHKGYRSAFTYYRDATAKQRITNPAIYRLGFEICAHAKGQAKPEYVLDLYKNLNETCSGNIPSWVLAYFAPAVMGWQTPVEYFSTHEFKNLTNEKEIVSGLHFALYTSFLELRDYAALDVVIVAIACKKLLLSFVKMEEAILSGFTTPAKTEKVGDEKAVEIADKYINTFWVVLNRSKPKVVPIMWRVLHEYAKVGCGYASMKPRMRFLKMKFDQKRLNHLRLTLPAEKYEKLVVEMKEFIDDDVEVSRDGGSSDVASVGEVSKNGVSVQVSSDGDLVINEDKDYMLPPEDEFAPEQTEQDESSGYYDLDAPFVGVSDEEIVEVGNVDQTKIGEMEEEAKLKDEGKLTDAKDETRGELKEGKEEK
ncbi:hypothetical protein HK098_001091 [Nowakowskiella sp. JEL0407]|nr:hypothetical protein HK098_001091 [Nowakowskiella sp. JEL0407]